MRAFVRKDNVKNILEEILDLPDLKAEIRVGIRTRFEEVKDDLLRNFDQHPVTQEVANPDSENISNTLDGYENLYGFLGIPIGTDTVGAVRSVLEKGVKIRGSITISKKSGMATFKFTVPNLEDFDSAARLEWDTRNWVEGIEGGISGFQYFMNVKSGRSGRGIQIRAGLRGGKFKNRKYMSQLLNDFKRSF